MTERLVIAIDGPAGSGKSSIGRAVAARLGLAHLDTGGYYRAATLVALREGLDPADGPGIAEAVARHRISFDAGTMTIDGRNVESEIRGPTVTASVSEVSRHPAVRRHMVALQRQWVEDHGGRAVVDGRDIGTVVFPNAEHKVFLTASAEERARRRGTEMGDDPRQHLEAMRRRDVLDASREHSPLLPAADATLVDTTGLDLGQSIDAVLEVVDAVRGR